MLKAYNEVNVMATTGTVPMVVISFSQVADENMNMNDLEFELSEDQIKWLIKALKQGRDLAFR